jgi:hypothetical protein
MAGRPVIPAKLIEDTARELTARAAMPLRPNRENEVV